MLLIRQQLGFSLRKFTTIYALGISRNRDTITLGNVYKIMQNFGKLYAIMSDEEKKSLIVCLIKEIQIYLDGGPKMPLKLAEFNFWIYIDGREVRKVLWEGDIYDI